MLSAPKSSSPLVKLEDLCNASKKQLEFQSIAPPSGRGVAVSCIIDGQHITQGEGNTRRAAEDHASSLVLEQLQQEIREAEKAGVTDLPEFLQKFRDSLLQDSDSQRVTNRQPQFRERSPPRDRSLSPRRRRDRRNSRSRSRSRSISPLTEKPPDDVAKHAASSDPSRYVLRQSRLPEQLDPASLRRNVVPIPPGGRPARAVLNEYCQKTRLKLEFQLISSVGAGFFCVFLFLVLNFLFGPLFLVFVVTAQNQPVHSFRCIVDTLSVEGVGGSKAQAQEMAANLMLQELGVWSRASPAEDPLEPLSTSSTIGAVGASNGARSANARQLLNELSQKKGWTLSYVVVGSEGPVHDPVHRMALRIDNLDVEKVGVGKSKSTASEDAARQMLIELGVWQ